MEMTASHPKTDFDFSEKMFMIAFAIVIVFYLGFTCGFKYVHKEWKADAIRRCSKTQGQEWCVGRAELEKW